MLEDLACDDQIEMPVGIGIAIALGVEMIYIAMEIVIRKRNNLMIDFSRRPVISTPHFAIARDPVKQRGDLHVAAEFQNPASRLRRRNQRERPSQTGNMLGKVLARAFALRRKIAEGLFDALKLRGFERFLGHFGLRRQMMIHPAQQTPNRAQMQGLIQIPDPALSMAVSQMSINSE